MPTTAAEKTCRMDVRLTQPQRMSYEHAASLTGQSLSQWTTRNLDECARRDIEEATRTRLSREAFEQFCEMLEAPLPQETADLLSRETIWK